MTVKELIKSLLDFNGDTEVQFSYFYGDHANTEVSDPIEIVAEGNIQWSEYHNTFKVLTEDDSGSFKTVIILR